jgi:C1A family cysteine protease
MQRIIAAIPFIFCFISFNFYEDHYRSFTPKENISFSSIKKQHWGTCWSFSTISSLESSILTQKLNHTSDLSEYHLDKYNGFNRNGNAEDPKDDWYSSQGKGFVGSNKDSINSGLLVHLGGDYFVSTAYLANTLGAVEENKTPKIKGNKDFKNFGWTSKDGVLLKNNYKHIFPKRVEWLSRTGSEKAIRNRIKRYIRMHGSVSSAQFMNPKPTSYYKGREVHLNLREKSPNHAINIIGWDDGFYQDGQYGAWIIKDSDHEIDSSGEKLGPFYIPYSDLITGKDKNMGAVSFNSVEVRDTDTLIYTHSLHGWRYDFKFAEKVKSRFIITEEEQLITGIGIYIPTEKTTSNISIVINSRNITNLKPFYSEFPGFYYLKTPAIKISPNSVVDLIQKNSSDIYALDSTSKIEVLLGTPQLKPQEVESKSDFNQSFYQKKSNWIDLKSRDNIKEIDFTKANFAINLYTKRGTKE